jgi:CubicO group peptidase (beta-lactamase class C family)
MIPMLRSPRARATRALALLLVLGALGAPLHAQHVPAIEGEWAGAIELPTDELRVEVRFTRADDAWRGSIDIPQQNARSVPLAGIRVAGDSVIFTIQDIPGEPTFAGVLADDGTTLAGEFRQAGQSFPFALRRAPAAAAMAAAALDGIEAVIEQAMRDFLVPGLAIAVVRNDEVVYARGFGYRDVARELPVTPETLFAIGSSTKAFTTFALGMLADSGRFDWDAPARSYIPELRLWDDVATLRLTTRDMVTHRSGLPRHDLAWYNAHDLTSPLLLERVRYFEPNRGLRERWQYNNIMYVLAGHVLSRLTGRSWEDAVAALVFEPLGMRTSNFSVAVMQRAPDHALPYREHADTLVRLAFRNIDNVGPAGSINSSVAEMAQWLRVHLAQGRLGERRIIGGSTLRDMHTPHMVMGGMPTEAALSPSSYGLGWVIQTYRGSYRVQHGGNIDGFSALVTLFPRDGLGVVVLTNMNGTSLPGLVTNHVADRMLELETRDWIAEALTQRQTARAAQAGARQRLAEERQSRTRPSFPLADYAGEYEHPGYGVLRIDVDRQRLLMRYNDMVTPFEHWHYDVFNGQENVSEPVFRDTKLQFVADLRGRIDAVQIAMEPLITPIRFERRPDALLRDPAFLARLAGRYTLEAGGQLLITVRGERLTAEVAGNPPYVLEPDRDHTFRITELSGYAVRFVLDADGTVKEAQLVQPNGVFVATPARSP